MSKHVMITGCTRGLGLAMARSFAARGWRVSGCGTKQDAVERLTAELGKKGQESLIRTCDVTSGKDVATLAGEILAAAGAPDLLLNNAAIINRNAPLWEVSPEDFSRVIDVNLKGIHLVLRAFLPAMIARGRGVIVNFSSGWGRSTSPEVAPYCCTKWGVEGLTQALSQELPPRPRRRRPESRHHRYRNAAKHLRPVLLGFPGPRHMGGKSRPVSRKSRPARQRQGAHGASGVIPVRLANKRMLNAC